MAEFSLPNNSKIVKGKYYEDKTGSQNIKKVIVQALRKARVCSYDPVCLDNKSQGLNGTNASACHACTFLSETSCEEANQLLDRTTVIGDIINNQQGYFKDLLKD